MDDYLDSFSDKDIINSIIKDVTCILSAGRFRLHNSGTANNHVAAVFQDRLIFVFTNNLDYSLLKNARQPNLWLPCGGICSNFIILNCIRKYRSRGVVVFKL